MTFRYDSLGRRIQKIFTQGTIATTTNYAYDSDNIIETTDATGNVLGRNTQGQNVDEPLALQSGTAVYYQADGLGSVTSLTDISGASVTSYDYDSFGGIVASNGTLANASRYTARQYDSETHLYYYRARYYDATVGRFLSEDPIEFLAGVNFYTYVHNDPINLLDPSGLDDHNDQQTLNFLREAYASATAGRIQGLRNIYNNSTGKYDFGYNPEYEQDTWTWCGKKMNADQFGNFITGFEGAAYDQKYFWTTGAGTAMAGVEIYGVLYHMKGKGFTKSKNDPWDKTGRPDIRAGEDVGWNFAKNSSACKCGGGGGGGGW